MKQKFKPIENLIQARLRFGPIGRALPAIWFTIHNAVYSTLVGALINHTDKIIIEMEKE